MKLHTKLAYHEVWQALINAKNAGHVTDDVTTVIMVCHNSQTHKRAFEVQLGTYDKNSLPAGTRDQHGKTMRVRRFKNSGKSGAYSGGAGFGRCDDSVWAATYDEWGWFIAEVFKLDPGARFGPKPRPGSPGWGIYDGPDDFNQKTNDRFKS